MNWFPFSIDWRNKKRRSSETAPQVKSGIGVSHTGELGKPSDYGTVRWAQKLDLMRRQPTIAFARILAAAPILAADWSIDKDSGNDVDFIDQYIIQPFKFHLSKHAAFGMIDWGWQPFDVEYTLEDGNLIPSWYKPLLQQFTSIIVHENGKLHYLVNQVPHVQSQQTNALSVVPVHPSNSLVMSSGVEGTNWYGHALMANVELTYDDYVANKRSMQRYAQKFAGSGVDIAFPAGITNGEDNESKAARLASEFHVIGGVWHAKNEDEIDNWEIKMLEGSGGTGIAPYIENAKYLDAEFFRALHLSERSGLEGQFGTKAESETQKDFSIEAQVCRHIEMLEGLNIHLQYLTQLHYDNATARIVPAPLNQEKIAYFRSIYEKILADPTGLEMESIDMDELREMIGLPILSEEKRKALDFSNFDLTDQKDADETAATSEDPLTSTNVLNGAQISSAIAIAEQAQAGTLTEVFVSELLKALGLPDDAVNRMTESLRSLPPKPTVPVEPVKPKISLSRVIQASRILRARNVIEAAFCPTGDDGGIDNTCEPANKGRGFEDQDEADAFGNTHYKKWAASRSTSQRAALKTYVDNSIHINDQLRETSTASEARDMTEEIAELDAAIEAATPLKEPIVVNRGIFSLKKGGIDSLEEGDVITDGGFMSTSLDRSTAREFTGKNGALLAITVPEGTKAAWVHPFMEGQEGYRNQSELILPRGTSLRITRIERDTNPDLGIVAHAEIVSND